jgi:putative oxidoreductase
MNPPTNAPRNLLVRCYLGWIWLLKFAQPVFLLAIRVLVGWGFILAGWGKLTNIAATAAYFAKLGIPAPELNAWMAGLSETVAGGCLILGLASRITTIPLIVTMIVAYVTADRTLFTGVEPRLSCISVFIQAFLRSDEFPFLLGTLIVLLFGPGLLSVDGVLKRLFFGGKERARP